MESYVSLQEFYDYLVEIDKIKGDRNGKNMEKNKEYKIYTGKFGTTIIPRQHKHKQH